MQTSEQPWLQIIMTEVSILLLTLEFDINLIFDY